MNIPTPGTRRNRYLVAAAATVVLLWTAALLFLPADLAETTSNFGLAGVATAAGVAGLLRGRRHTGGNRWFWLLLGSGVLCWAAGQVIWTDIESLQGREVPSPSPADIGYLLLPPLAAVAMLVLPSGVRSLAGRVRSLVDALCVGSSLLLLGWVLVLSALLHSDEDRMLALATQVAYPVGDLVVITMVICTVLRLGQSPTRNEVPLGLVAVGLLAFACSDVSFVYLNTTGAYSSGSLGDIGWFTGFVLLLLAALQPSSGDGRQDRSAGRAAVAELLPYVSIVVAMSASVVEMLRTGETDAVSYWLRTSIMLFLVLRQLFTLRENQLLTRELEDRVEARTVELHTSRQRFAALVQHSSDLVTVITVEGRVTYQSPSSERILGVRAEDLVGRTLIEAGSLVDEATLRQTIDDLAPGSSITLQSGWRTPSDRPLILESTLTNLVDNPDVAGVVLNSRDVTDRVELERQLTHQAFTDSLTGLPNRALFVDRLEQSLAGSGTGAVMFLDLDGFKSVNDTLGHGAGDTLLVAVADRLQEAVRAGDTVARFGGDEFAVFAPDLQTGADASSFAERLAEELRLPHLLHGEVVHAPGSIGIAVVANGRPGRRTADDLLREADLAMYQAKGSQHGGFAVFHPNMHEKLLDRVRLEADLREALVLGQFSVHYQPMIDMVTGSIRGVEALARWNHPVRGNVTPDVFIPVAESTGLILELGDWVLREACRNAAAWGRDPKTGEFLRLSVNLSAQQVQQPDIVDQVRQTLLHTGFPADRLTLELTESVLVDRGDATVDSLTALRALGIRVAIDDFGTGYSSLSYLHAFPVDVLKIDKSFVNRLTGGGDTAIVFTILGLARSLHLEAVAEGVEEQDQWDILRDQGCQIGQGYHFSPPVQASGIVEMLAWGSTTDGVIREQAVV